MYLGDVDSFSPLMTINSMGLVVSAELHNNIEVTGGKSAEYF